MYESCRFNKEGVVKMYLEIGIGMESIAHPTKTIISMEYNGGYASLLMCMCWVSVRVCVCARAHARVPAQSHPMN